MNVLTRSAFSFLLLVLLGFAWISTSQAQEVQVNSANPNSALQGTIDLDVEISGSGFDNSATAKNDLQPIDKHRRER